MAKPKQQQQQQQQQQPQPPSRKLTQDELDLMLINDPNTTLAQLLEIQQRRTLPPTWTMIAKRKGRNFGIWVLRKCQALFLLGLFCVLGTLLGFGMGSGYCTGQLNQPPSQWRMTLGVRLRDTIVFQILSGEIKLSQIVVSSPLLGIGAIDLNAMYNNNEDDEDDDEEDDYYEDGEGMGSIQRSPKKKKNKYGKNNNLKDDEFGDYHYSRLPQRHMSIEKGYGHIVRHDPSHPYIFAVLREAIVREKGGYVHPDLGVLQPAPSGAARGIGIVRNSWKECKAVCREIRQQRERREEWNRKNTTTVSSSPPSSKANQPSPKNKNDTSRSTSNRKRYEHNNEEDDVLIKVPLKYQMTRDVALQTLLPLIAADSQRKTSIHELDDAALLVLLLAHERGVGKYSRWLPYIASLPTQPSCGYSAYLRPWMVESLQTMKEELGVDTLGWSTELMKAGLYAEKIASGLTFDYALALKHPRGVSPLENIQWSLCQVASRAIAGSQRHGSLRLIPLMDMINHDVNAGGYVELTGKERKSRPEDDDDDNNGSESDDGSSRRSHHHTTTDFLDATELDSGTFVIRSLRYERRKVLKLGQELLVNYNVPNYAALDWFVSMGFVPPERLQPWQKMDAALPRVRRDLWMGSPSSSSGSGGSGAGSASGGSGGTTTTTTTTTTTSTNGGGGTGGSSSSPPIITTTTTITATMRGTFDTRDVAQSLLEELMMRNRHGDEE